MKKIIFLIMSIVIGILVNQKSNEIIIPSDAIRVRFIANSNNINDSSTSASQSIRNNLNDIKMLISQKTNDFKINYGSNYFPKKVYKGVVYPEGEYESLVITLGNGLGDNWWCVLYPPLCMIDDNKTTNDVEYRFLVADMLKIDTK